MSKRNNCIAVIMVALALTGCAKKQEAAPGAPQAPVTLSLNHVGAIDHSYHFGSLKFAELVKEYSDGSLIIDVFPASQIASGAKAVEFVQMGTLDVALESTMAFGNFVMEVGVLDMPFLFESKEKAFRIMDGEIGKEIEAAAEARGFKVLAWWDNGFRNISNSVRPIHVPEDLKGMKIRVPESKVFLGTFQALGAIPTPTSLAEVFIAMQLHTVDGQENSGTLFIAQRYAEVNSYYSITQHIYSPEPLIMSTGGFGALSPEHQAVMLKAAKEAGDFQRKLSIEMEGKELDTIIAGGTKVNSVEDISLFQRAVQPVYDSFEADFGPLIRKIQAAQR